MDNIRILRLKDGQDIICNVLTESTQTIDILDPMVFAVRNANLMIQQWLPLAVIKDTQVNLKQDDILCSLQPNESFREYYQGLVSKINDVVENNDLSKASVDKIKELIEALENSPSDDTPLH
jgi:MinD-like ATPase involved in chromosome partitioning or flagellar assembly